MMRTTLVSLFTIMLLTGCAEYVVQKFPSQVDKVAHYADKAKAQYCTVNLVDRVEIRRVINEGADARLYAICPGDNAQDTVNQIILDYGL